MKAGATAALEKIKGIKAEGDLCTSVLNMLQRMSDLKVGQGQKRKRSEGDAEKEDVQMQA